jgi:glutamate-1-semialdehyde 2,1-aminomutase
MSLSKRLLERACGVIPAGVNSPVRAFAAVGGEPPFIDRGEGAEIIDVDGHRYIDLVGSWGALLLGHAPPAVVSAVIDAVRRGSSFGAPTAGEVDLALAIRERVPSMERVRLCSSGSEATMHAIRLARGATGRDLIVKVEGCYHGAHDALLVSAGSGVATFARPGCAGIPDAVAACTLVVPFNDLDAVDATFARHGDRIAGMIVEPVPGNMGCVEPLPGYLQGLRRITEHHGALLVMDEVMTGFRLAAGGAQERFGVRPDLTCLGKIVGGGLPLAAFGGRADLMERLSPLGPVYQAGTLSGNPVAVAAGLATLQHLDADVYARLEDLGGRIEAGLRASVGYHGWSLVRVGSMFTLYARPAPPRDFRQVQECDTVAFGQFHRSALNGGIYLPPSQFEAAFLTSVLTEVHVDAIVAGVSAALVSAAH